MLAWAQWAEEGLPRVLSDFLIFLLVFLTSSLLVTQTPCLRQAEQMEEIKVCGLHASPLFIFYLVFLVVLLILWILFLVCYFSTRWYLVFDVIT